LVDAPAEQQSDCRESAATLTRMKSEATFPRRHLERSEAKSKDPTALPLRFHGGIPRFTLGITVFEDFS
jgi:hypothetical protein